MHTQSSNLTEVRWAQYICNYENNVLSLLSSQWFCGKSCTWEWDVWLHMVPIKQRVLSRLSNDLEWS